MTDPNLGVRTTVSGLITPISMAFIGPNDFLIVEKNTGAVKRVTNGVVQGTVLDLGVNNASERGLLGIALHSNFPSNPGVYLFWTCRTAEPQTIRSFLTNSSAQTQICSLQTLTTSSPSPCSGIVSIDSIGTGRHLPSITM